MKLHLGCGKRDFGEDWIHIDGSDYEHIKYHNITKLPFDNNTVDIIYACGVLEYFDNDECINVLQEWKRVLKVNGILRLSVPDFEPISKLYSEGKYPIESFLGPIFGKWEMNDKTIYHRTVFDFKSLEKILKKCNFNNIRKWDWRKTEHSNIDDYSQAYLPHMDKENGTQMCLNLECDKI